MPPKTPADAKLSKKHLKESIKFNKSHAKDHLKAANKAAKLLAGGGGYSRLKK